MPLLLSLTQSGHCINRAELSTGRLGKVIFAMDDAIAQLT